MARLQAEILAHATRRRRCAPTVVDEAAMLRRYGPELGPLCIAEMRKTALDGAGAEAFNRSSGGVWPTLRTELAPMADPGRGDGGGAGAAGGADHGEELGLPPRPLARRHPLLARDPRPLVLRQPRRRCRRCSTPCWRTSIDAARRRDCPAAVCRDLLGVFTDIDDTLTDRGPPAGGGLCARWSS